MKVLFVVTHLLGAGHLSRALTLGRAFVAAGHQVCLASGGRSVPQFDSTGIDLVQLPSLASDGTNFTALLADDDTPASLGYLQARSDALIATTQQFAPDAVITELFPFGRRVLTDEFLRLLHAMKTQTDPPLVLASVRDILAPPSKPSKAARTEEIVAQYYDAVLVHSDPASVRLDVSWPVTAPLAEKLRYTGYVAPPQTPRARHNRNKDILVSAGGGSVGKSLYETALAAAHASPDLHWHVLVGGQDAQNRIAQMQIDAPPNATLEPARPDFRKLMAAAGCSVSMCGYNTALDVLQTDTPAVFVPFDDGGETEQSLRAQGLGQLSAIRVVSTADLSGARLLKAVKEASREQRQMAQDLQFDGAAQSVAIVQSMCEGAR